MALSGLDIYKLLPKTNCRECGFATCLAFAMQLAKKSIAMEKCPYISAQSKLVLEASALPPIRLASLGTGENKFEIGNETVMFRHEEKFRNPTAVGFLIDDNLNDAQIKQKVEKINKLKLERVGEKLNVNLIAVRQIGLASRFVEAVKLISDNTSLTLVLMGSEVDALGEAARLIKDKKPLLYGARKENLAQFCAVAKELSLPLVISAPEIDELAALSADAASQGVNNLILQIENDNLAQNLWNLTQIRRQALKKSNRALGYPTLAIVDKDDPYEEAIGAAALIAKYAGIVLIKGLSSWEVLSVLTLRQNIYTDPQKPLQIESKLYPVGLVNKDSPLLITTNFSLSYFTVLAEAEASKIPVYILSVNTEGMSVLTAWAAEKFNAQTITHSINHFRIKEILSHKKIIIPGYVAVISGELEEESGFQVIVGPKEAAGIPAFLKKYNC